MRSTLQVRLVAEFIGTGLLVAAVIGSGIMAERLFSGSIGLALLANTIATGAALLALILTFGPISGAHFNPVVSFSEVIGGGMRWPEAVAYVSAQCVGGISGTILAHAMFGLDMLSFSQHARSGFPLMLSEFVATFGLVSVIWGCSKSRSSAIPFAVAGYITSAYWFTASTSFANPAVTLARLFSNTFAGIRPLDVPAFLLAQFAGGLAATLLFRWLSPVSKPQSTATVLQQ
jgi:glycerol uptake facilitator-like aquaporin